MGTKVPESPGTRGPVEQLLSWADRRRL